MQQKTIGGRQPKSAFSIDAIKIAAAICGFFHHDAQKEAASEVRLLAFYKAKDCVVGLKVPFDQVRKAPSVPSGLRFFVIGDIHGRADLLETLLARTKKFDRSRPATRSVYIFLGDYIDRGPSSFETLDRLIAHGSAHECVFLKGNHEAVAMRSLVDVGTLELWLKIGGQPTLLSYGITAQPDSVRTLAGLQLAFHEALPGKHVQFFRDLRTTFVCGEYFFVHAGVRPCVPFKQQREEDLLWIGNEFLNWPGEFEKVVVHGHTAVNAVEFRGNRINIDTGAFATNRLTCLVLENTTATTIDTLA